MSEAGTVAVNLDVDWESLDSWVAVPPVGVQATCDVLVKLEPLTVSVKLAPPSLAEVGLMLVTAATATLAPKNMRTISSAAESQILHALNIICPPDPSCTGTPARSR